MNVHLPARSAKWHSRPAATCSGMPESSTSILFRLSSSLLPMRHIIKKYVVWFLIISHFSADSWKCICSALYAGIENWKIKVSSRFIGWNGEIPKTSCNSLQINKLILYYCRQLYINLENTNRLALVINSWVILSMSSINAIAVKWFSRKPNW